MTTQPLARSYEYSGPSRAENATAGRISRNRQTGGTDCARFETIMSGGAQTPSAAQASDSAPAAPAASSVNFSPSAPDPAATNPFAITSKIKWVPAQSKAEPPAAPTAESVFGPKPWIENAEGQGPNGTKWSFNPLYFATPETAQKVADMFGGKVVQQNSILSSGPMVQLQPNQMVELPNGRIINPGFIAGFYTHGYPQSYVDQLIAAEIGGGPQV